MDYTQLKVDIQDICETTFTDAQLAMFTEQAEQKIYNSVQIPALRKNVTGSVTASNTYLDIPSDFLWSYSLAVIDGDGNYSFLLTKTLTSSVKHTQRLLLQGYRYIMRISTMTRLLLARRQTVTMQ